MPRAKFRQPRLPGRSAEQAQTAGAVMSPDRRIS
jgi:hypothetical protein